MKKIVSLKNKISRYSQTHKKRIGHIRMISGALLFSLIFLPPIAFSAGNVFFGGSKHLYNLKLAHGLFWISAHPISQVLTPRYAHYQLSRTYFIEGDLQEALDEARKELEIYPEDTSTYYILGLTYGYLGRSHEGIDAFSNYIEVNPGTWAARNDKAWLQMRVGDMNGALETIQPIAQQFLYTPWVQNTYCSLLINTKKLIEAKAVCTHAKEIVDKMTADDWGRAYPGNDPRIYAAGVDAMKKSAEHNMSVLNEKLGK